LIQTYHPENQVIRWAAERDYQNFYAFEIKERQALSYPPFSKIIKLSYRDFSVGITEREAQRVYQRLISANSQKSDIQIYPPLAPYIPKIRNRFIRQIVLKIKNQAELPSKLKAELKALPNGWNIDVDPISLI